MFPIHDPHGANLIASANVADEIIPALLRPGRFDEIIVVDSTPEEVTRKILGEFSSSFDDVKDLPIAYINEFKDLAKVMGHDYAKQVLPGLRERYEKCKWSK